MFILNTAHVSRDLLIMKHLISLFLITTLCACVPAQVIPTPTTQNEQPSQQTQEAGSPIASQQIAFISESQVSELAKAGPTVLFFKANWCPTCQAAQKDLDARLSQLPEGTTIVTVDYDTESKLKTKYGITYQHTWVQVDETGKALVTWNGGGVDEIKRSLVR